MPHDISILVLGTAGSAARFISNLPTRFKPYVCHPAQPIDAAIRAYRPKLVVEIAEHEGRRKDLDVEAQAYPLNVVRFRFGPGTSFEPESIERALTDGIQARTGSPFPPALDRLVGTSAPIVTLKHRLQKYAKTSACVVLLGENGTGKDLCANLLHELSERAGGPFVAVNCGAIAETLSESELFGSVKGAFTGAETRKGYFQEANGGTLFLDEIGDLPASLQVKLLRVLENNEVRRVGSSAKEAVDFRLVCATNKDLKTLVSEGRFRADLYFRIYVLPVLVPALRERGEDVGEIARSLLGAISPEVKISAAAIRKIKEYDWPGNVRQLRNVLQRSVVLSNSSNLAAEDIDLEGE